MKILLSLIYQSFRKSINRIIITRGDRHDTAYINPILCENYTTLFSLKKKVRNSEVNEQIIGNFFLDFLHSLKIVTKCIVSRSLIHLLI